MATIIDDPERARRLAKAICSDVALYNEGPVREAAPAERAGLLQQPVSEARELYVSRVAPELLGIFEEEVRNLEQRLGSGPIPLDAPMAAPRAHPPVPRREPMSAPEARSAPEPVGGAGGGFPLALAALALVAILGIAGWFLLLR